MIQRVRSILFSLPFWVVIFGGATAGLFWLVLNREIAPAPEQTANGLVSVDLSTAAHATGNDAAPSAAVFADSSLDLARFDTRLDQMMAMPELADELTGLAVAVVEDGEIVYARGLGVTDRETGEPVTVATVFRWASVSKGVAASLAARLDEEGALDLDRPIGRYNTSLRLPGDGLNQATLADVLSHRLGLWRNAFDDRLEGGADPRDIRRELGALPVQCEPGDCYSYQNVAFDTASEAIENSTGRSYAALVREKLFEPLGMRSASIGMQGLVGANSWARPYRGTQQLTVLPNYYRVPAAAGVNSNILDLARWMQAQMGLMPNVLSPDALDELHRARVDTGRSYSRSPAGRALVDPAYGLGWRSMTYRGHALVGHGGAVAGYRSNILFDPQRRTGVAMLWNSSSGRPFAMQLELLDMVYGNDFTNWAELDDGAALPGAELPVAAGD